MQAIMKIWFDFLIHCTISKVRVFTHAYGGAIPWGKYVVCTGVQLPTKHSWCHPYYKPT